MEKAFNFFQLNEYHPLIPPHLDEQAFPRGQWVQVTRS